MKKSLIKSLLAVSALGLSTYAVSAPNIWGNGFGQGWMEYGIEDTKGNVLRVVCNVGADDDRDHRTSLELHNGKRIEFPELVVDGTSYSLSMGSNTRLGENEWISFLSDISKAKSIKAYNNNKLLATFKPTAKSRKNAPGSDESCDPKP